MIPIERNEEGVCLLGTDAKYCCPICAVTLADAAIDGYRLFYCGKCRGTLVPVPVFVSLLDDLRAKQGGAWRSPGPADRSQLGRQIHCPQCGRLMDTHFYGGPGNVVIDDCAHCELNWLDQGELTRIVRAPERAG